MIKDLEIAGLEWLRWQRRCPLVFFERGVRNAYYSRPDICGITSSRHVIEIEVKRSVADFRSNAHKRHIVHRDAILCHFPKWFYFLVPEKIACKVESEVPEWAGLLVLKHSQLTVFKSSPINAHSMRISVKEMAKLVRVLGNQIVSSERKLFNYHARFTEGEFDYGLEYQI